MTGGIKRHGRWQLTAQSAPRGGYPRGVFFAPDRDLRRAPLTASIMLTVLRLLRSSATATGAPRDGFTISGLGLEGFGLGLEGFGLGIRAESLGIEGFGLGLEGFGLGIRGRELGYRRLRLGLEGFGLGIRGRELGVSKASAWS